MIKQVSGGAESGVRVRSKGRLRFGKRACMVALATLMTVAVIVPTTVLAETHGGG